MVLHSVGVRDSYSHPQHLCSCTRLLSALMALSLAPLFMGDTLQVFCLSHWKLTNT